MLQEITRLNLDYLSHLDYVDLKFLSHTNKDLYKILNEDKILRNILYKIAENDIYFPPNFPISKALNELYNKITSFVNVLYPNNMEWPKWINIEIFKRSMKNTIYLQLSNQISTLLNNNGEGILNKLKIFNLEKAELIFPFTAYNNIYYLNDTDIQTAEFYKHFDMILNLPDIILDYFKLPLLFLLKKYDKRDKIIAYTISNLLYIREHTYHCNIVKW